MPFTNLTFFCAKFDATGVYGTPNWCRCCHVYSLESTVYVDQALINLVSIVDGSILVVAKNEDEDTAFWADSCHLHLHNFDGLFDEVGGGLLQRL